VGTPGKGVELHSFITALIEEPMQLGEKRSNILMLGLPVVCVFNNYLVIKLTFGG